MSAAQAKAEQLNAKMESEARLVLDSIDRLWLRKVARSSYSCVVACFDKAGTTGSAEVLDQCSRNCLVKHQNANALTQNVSVWVVFLMPYSLMRDSNSEVITGTLTNDDSFTNRKQLNSRTV
jgi:Eukaryotic protein of unknown function (DUF842)